MCIFNDPVAPNRFPASSGRRSDPHRGSRASELLLGDGGPLGKWKQRPKQAGSEARPPRLNYQGGAPLNDAPLSEWNLHPIVDFGAIRHDRRGSGDFGAPRDKRERAHGGVDIAVPAGTSVYAPAGGTISIITLDSAHRITGVQIATDDQRLLKVLYVAPLEGIANGTRVRAGQPIGKSQSLQEKYPPTAAGAMRDHVHFQAERRDQDPPALVDPTETVREWLYPPKY
jgi:murein DD-endopeptidase MepM/ murein hydrolase activator NlpD